MRKQFLIAATALAISAVPAALAAQGGATKPAPAKTGAATAASKPGAAAPKVLTPEEKANIQRAYVIMRAFTLAFQSKDVQQPVKAQLLTCLYNNKLSAISSATERVFAQNASLKKDDATTIYRVAAGVCGIAFQRADGKSDPGAAAVPGAPGAPKAAATEGR